MPGWRLAIVGGLLTVGTAVGQTTPVAARGDMPPFALPAPDAATLPNGSPVSRPLSPVEEPPTALETLTAPAIATVEEVKSLGSSWSNYEYLLWWPKAQPLPLLATSGRGPLPPVLGSPGTALLLGQSSLANPDVSGARFTWGSALNADQTAGLEVTYLFLGTRTASASISSVGSNPPQFLGRPVVNPQTGANDAVLVSRPGTMAGSLDVSATSRVTGWEITGVANLLATPGLRVNALAGYRYFMLNEGLRLNQLGWRLPSAAEPAGALLGAADQFDAHNRFHGGQLGLHTDYVNGSVFVELTGKVGLGQAVEVVQVSGQSVAIAPTVPFPTAQVYQGGVLGQPSNSGRFVQSRFAVLPEGTVKVGYRFQDRSRFYFGYNFLYLSDAVRPGDQVDRTLDPAQVPVFGRPGGMAVLVADRPQPLFARSDFWVQGLIFGLEYRY